MGRRFRALAEDEAVRLLVVTGADGHFSAGADIGEFDRVRADATLGRAYDREVDDCHTALTDIGKPTVAAIGGVCVGGGLGLALACDFRIADGSARFGIPAARLGVVYSMAECRALADVVGLVNAKRVLFRVDIFDVVEGARMGLVDRVTDGDVLGAALDFAGAMAENAPLTIAGCKLILNAIAAGRADERSTEITAAIDRAMDSEDYKEGARAFMAKPKTGIQGALGFVLMV